MEMERKDDLKKTHEGVIHTITVHYPQANVTNMKQAWKEKIEEGGVWLENFEKSKEDQYKTALAQMDLDEEKVRKEMAELGTLTEEQLLQKLKERNADYLKIQQQFLNSRKEREAALKEELDKNMERIKKQLYDDVKEKRNALKFWSKV